MVVFASGEGEVGKMRVWGAFRRLHADPVC